MKKKGVFTIGRYPNPSDDPQRDSHKSGEAGHYPFSFFAVGFLLTFTLRLGWLFLPSLILLVAAIFRPIFLPFGLAALALDFLLSLAIAFSARRAYLAHPEKEDWRSAALARRAKKAEPPSLPEAKSEVKPKAKPKAKSEAESEAKSEANQTPFPPADPPDTP